MPKGYGGNLMPGLHPRTPTIKTVQIGSTNPGMDLVKKIREGKR